MFVTLGGWFETFFSGYAGIVAGKFGLALTPVALALVTAYICLYGYSLMRGEASEPLGEFSWKMIRIAAILGVALTSANYADIVIKTATDLQDGMATVFLAKGTTGGPAASAKTVWEALDLIDRDSVVMQKLIWKSAGLWRLDMLLASFIFGLGTAVFILIAAFVTLFSKVVLTFGLAIGPLAIICLIFKQTTRFFDSWISYLLSAIVLAWLTFFALGVSFYVGEAMLAAMDLSKAFASGAPATAANGVGASIQYLVVMLLLGLLLWQAPGLASSLTSGPAVSSGGRMIANMLGAGASGGGGRGGGGRGGGGGGGGSMSNGSASYAAGKALGSAYQRVAQRGRGG